MAWEIVQRWGWWWGSRASSVSKKLRGTRRSGPGKPGRPRGGESPGRQNQRRAGRHGGGHRWAVQSSDRRWEPDCWELRGEWQQLTELLLWRDLDCRKGMERRAVAARRARGSADSLPPSTRQDLRIFSGLSEDTAWRYWSLRGMGESVRRRAEMEAWETVSHPEKAPETKPCQEGCCYGGTGWGLAGNPTQERMAQVEL